MAGGLVIIIVISIASLSSAGIFSGLNISTMQELQYDGEFSKDVASLMVEANLESNCEGNVFITTKACGDYLDYTLSQLSEWAPPVILVTFQEYRDIGNVELWAKYLAWDKRACSIIFVCDLMISDIDLTDNFFGSSSGIQLGTPEEEIGHLQLPKFVDSSDQVLYLSNFLEDTLYADISGGNRTSGENTTIEITTIYNEVQGEILKRSGIMLQIVLNQTNIIEPESVMQVYSLCTYCGGRTKWRQQDLGYWQRNKTLFGKHFHIFEDFHKLSFNQTNLGVGYFNHQPHFSCFYDGIFTSSDNEFLKNDTGSDEEAPALDDMVTKCEGVEWEMISQMAKSLEFTMTWINLSNPDISQQELGQPNNISNMIAAFEAGKIDLAVGGISVTPKRTMYVDFSSVFANDPIVFVVRKKGDVFALGIWLAFNPEIWPLLLIMVIIISILFHIIIYQYTLKSPLHSTSKRKSKWALSAILHKQYYEKRKPLHVIMFEALEVTLQPLLGQPLGVTQITHRPRRLLKLLLVVWWFSSLIISTLYNTSLITALINPISREEPETLQDLLDSGYQFKPAGKQGAFFELVKAVLDKLPKTGNEDDIIPEDENDEQPDDSFNEASKKERNAMSLIKQISDRLVRDTETSSAPIAYVIEESAVKRIKWDKKEIGFSQIKVIRERFFLTTYAWPTQRHAPFKSKIDSALGRLNAAGLVNHWYRRFQHRDKKDGIGMAFRLREKLGQIVLNMQVLQGAFIFLIIGQALGALILGIEHLTKRYRFRLLTRFELRRICGKISSNLKRLYENNFAAEHEELQLRRKRNRIRGAVRPATTARKVNVETQYTK